LFLDKTLEDALLNLRKHVAAVSKHCVDHFERICSHHVLVSKQLAYKLFNFSWLFITQLALEADDLEIRKRIACKLSKFLKLLLDFAIPYLTHLDGERFFGAGVEKCTWLCFFNLLGLSFEHLIKAIQLVNRLSAKSDTSCDVCFNQRGSLGVEIN
jgi:dolichol kinase